MIMHQKKFKTNSKFLRKNLILWDNLRLKQYFIEFSIILDLIRVHFVIFIIIVFDFNPL